MLLKGVPMMKPTCQELLNILQKQMQIYRQLKELGTQKREYLIKGSLEGLNEVTKQEEVCIFQLGKLEEEREDCFAHLAELGGFEQNWTLREIIPHLPEEEQKELRKVQEDFSVLIRDLEQLNHENTSLLQQSLRFVNFTVDVLSQQSKPVYDEEKEVKVKQLTNLLDKKI